MSRAAHRRIYSSFTAPSFIHKHTNIHPFPSQQPIQALIGIKGINEGRCLAERAQKVALKRGHD
jgi:hypothetical protein